jgi:hypothetical protein
MGEILVLLRSEIRASTIYEFKFIIYEFLGDQNNNFDQFSELRKPSHPIAPAHFVDCSVRLFELRLARSGLAPRWRHSSNYRGPKCEDDGPTMCLELFQRLFLKLVWHGPFDGISSIRRMLYLNIVNVCWKSVMHTKALKSRQDNQEGHCHNEKESK